MRTDHSPGDPTDAPDAYPDVPGMGIVRSLAVVVPSSRRAEWVAEWEGELHHAWRERVRAGDDTTFARIALGARALGAVRDAIWLRRHEGAHDMLGLDLKYAVRG